MNPVEVGTLALAEKIPLHSPCNIESLLVVGLWALTEGPPLYFPSSIQEEQMAPRHEGNDQSIDPERASVALPPSPWSCMSILYTTGHKLKINPKKSV